MKYYVRVLKRDTNDVVKTLGPMSDRRAEKVERGLLINMNHDDYYTEVIDSETVDKEEKNDAV